jgi:hypothetical protein
MRLFALEHGLEPLHDLCRLMRVRPRADLEIDVRTRDREIVEEHLR